jgi:flagellar FliL protein
MAESVMSDKPAEPEPTPPPATRASRAVLLLLALNLGASGFATFKLVTAAAAAPAKPAEPPPAHEIAGPVVALDPFVVNLDEPGTSRYLRVSIQLELTGADTEAAIEHSKQLVRDDVLGYLSGLHVKDTLGSDGKDKIRKDLLAALDKDLGAGKVRRMFFNEFVVQ